MPLEEIMFSKITDLLPSPLKRLFNYTHRGNRVLLNAVQEFIEIEACLLLTFSYAYTIN